MKQLGFFRTSFSSDTFLQSRQCPASYNIDVSSLIVCNGLGRKKQECPLEEFCCCIVIQDYYPTCSMLNPFDQDGLRVAFNFSPPQQYIIFQQSQMNHVNLLSPQNNNNTDKYSPQKVKF